MCYAFYFCLVTQSICSISAFFALYDWWVVVFFVAPQFLLLSSWAEYVFVGMYRMFAHALGLLCDVFFIKSNYCLFFLFVFPLLILSSALIISVVSNFVALWVDRKRLLFNLHITFSLIFSYACVLHWF